MQAPDQYHKEACLKLMDEMEDWFPDSAPDCCIANKVTNVISSRELEIALLAMWKPAEPSQQEVFQDVNMRNNDLYTALRRLASELGTDSAAKDWRHRVVFWFAKCESGLTYSRHESNAFCSI